MATLLELAAEIVSSHASVTSMSTEELLIEIQKVHAALKSIEAGTEAVVQETEEAKPALTVKEAFKKNEVICMVCGKGGFKTLARHLKQAHGLKPGEYKKQFGIPSKQPLAARSFSQSRREMAQERGLSEVLAKARETRAAKLRAEKAVPVKPVKKKAAPKVKKQTV
jgi:predicted transcriptional regulator